ncbi:MAG: DEAD/DEAH box helicase [Desulfurispora sp.]|uniref:DEAD/DEAH box helicase n=1 Tax=Desulfurispora sp. TaxID=3014275 RepID=UPI00404B6EE4
MLTVSANNQAVTNMIDSFGKVSKTDTLLSSRWLPGITSYGLYCPSQYAAQRQENQKYQIATAKSEFPATSGFMAKKESREYLLSAKEHYLQCCSKYYGCEIKTIDQAIKKLHTELTNNQLGLKKTIQQYLEAIRAQKQTALALEKIKAKYGSLDNLTQELLARKDELHQEETTLKIKLEQKKQSYNEAEQTYLETYRMVQGNISNHAVQGGIIRRFRYWLAQLLLGERRKTINSELSGTLTRMLEKSENNMKRAEEAVLACSQQIERLQREIKLLEDELAIIDESSKNTLPAVEEIQNKCDTELRYRSFLLATHYWEGRWLKEVEKAHEMYQRNIKVTPEEKLRSKWRRYAMLTPGLVSTLYMAPAMFTCWYREGENLYSQPLWEEIDLLIIDEAGQVSPEIAAATMALAKKAVVVGDIWQIEPVYNITRFVDQGNLLRVGLISSKDEYPELQSKGVTAQGGSVMLIAGRNCPYRFQNENGEPYSERGMWLREHRRCLDTIIDYCNQLVYRGQLLPLRGDQLKPGALPHFSAVHFADGVSSRAGSSRKNEKEAVFILEWLMEKKDYLLTTYGPDKALKEIVAVVVPFTAQKREFLKALRSNEKYAPLRGITIGTIHALQGAERDVVIFSPVYTCSDGTDYFFNSDVRMLNVAVSRAREAFVVIGDTEIFRKAGGAAGLLARYIFAEKSCIA